MSRKKIILFTIFSFSFSLLLALITGEVLVRQFADYHHIPAPPPSRAFNPYKPNNFIVNMRPYIFFGYIRVSQTGVMRKRSPEFG